MKNGKPGIKQRFHHGSIDLDFRKARMVRRRTLVHRLMIRRLLASLRRALATAGGLQFAPRKPVAST